MEYFLSDKEGTKYIPGYGNHNHLPTGELYIDIDKEKIKKSGIVPAGYEDKIVDRMDLSLSNKSTLMLNELAIIDMLSTNAEQGWKRPIYFASTVDPSLFTETDKYFMRTGMAYKIVPVELSNGSGRYQVDTDEMYDNVMNKFAGRYGCQPQTVYFDEDHSTACATPTASCSSTHRPADTGG